MEAIHNNSTISWGLVASSVRFGIWKGLTNRKQFLRKAPGDGAGVEHHRVTACNVGSRAA